MADHRITSVVRSTAGKVTSGACLLYGAVLSAGSGSASVTICDSITGAAVANAARVLPVYKSSPTGTTTALLPYPRQMSSGIFVSLAGAPVHVVVLYSLRD